ncbi:CHASE domain-containing protein [Novosphingobium sp.]|uniref:CHASE domain-containing protein n=1 Tax=Novosphingobium sp. TaxID=1874826 RepID=UPI002631AE72|nr:CHASE domain-containing protein [Novosphingobium sp.]
MERLLAQKKLTTRWYERFPRGVPVGIFTLTMAVTVLSVFAIERAEYQRKTAQIEQVAQEVASGIERQSNVNVAYLRSSAALFATQQMVEAPLFRTFVRQLHLDGRFVGSDGIGWAMKVRRADVPVVEAIMRDGGVKDFTITSAPQTSVQGNAQQSVVPIMFVEPQSERNQRVIGFDMFSESARRSAMLKAERSGQPTASGRVALHYEGEADGQPGFIIYMPVFTISEDRPGGNLRGYVFSPFNAQRFLQSALDAERLEGAVVRLHDRGAVVDGKQAVALMAQTAPDHASRRKVTRQIEIAAHTFVLEVEAPATPMLSSISALTLLFGLLVATLLLVLARLLTQQAMEDRIALSWFEQQSSIRNSLTRELNHRVKNTLANVLSIISLTRRRSDSVPEFADSLEGRIRALSATHDLLTQSDWGTTPVSAVVLAEIAPYAQDEQRHLEIGGPDVELAPNDALSLGLAIHELATNAAKYGALSVESGSVKISWEMAGEDVARIEWAERGGPPINPDTRRKRGFGTELIEKIVAHELRHPVDLKFEPEGVRCSLLIPVRRRTDFAIRQGRDQA